MDQFTYLSRNISSTESDVNICREKAWNAVDRLVVIWKSNQAGKIKWDFFQNVAVSILLYGCTKWTNKTEKKIDRNDARQMCALLNKSWRQHSTKYQLYGHLPSISQTIWVRQTRYVGHSWRCKDQLISQVS